MYYQEDLVNYFAALTDGPVVFDCCDGCRAANPRKVMKTQKRPQRQKASQVRHVQELRRSNAAGPHKPATDYNRKPKHGLSWEEDDDDDINAYYWR